MADKAPFVEAVKEHLTLFPDAPTLTIAKMIVGKYPHFDIEKIRASIRYYRGSAGAERKEKAMRNNPQFIRPWDGKFAVKPVNISTEDYIFNQNKPLILSDIHLPYHDIDAISVALEKGYKDGVDSLYLNGDILDFYQASRFTKDGGAMSVKEERDMFWEFIGWLKSNFSVPIYFKAGNHEERLEKYVNEKSPELAQLPELNLRNFLKLDEHNITYIEGRQKAIMGKLIVVHGHEFGESIFSPVNPARGLFLRAKSSTLAGHNHQTSEHHENNLRNDSMACFSTGCLCQLTPKYRPFAYTKWNHGFAIVEIDGDGSFEVNNYRIIDGKVR